MKSPPQINISTWIDVSDRMHDLIGGLNERGQLRVWGQILKSALSEVLVEHHRKRIPLHFKRAARQQYRYQERSPKYKAKKWGIFKSQLDLVKSGRTRERIERQRQIRFKGGASSWRTGGATIGQLIMQFPFPVARDNNRPGRVKIEQMKKEITATTDVERGEIEYGLGRRIVAAFNSYGGGQRSFKRSH